MDWAIRMPPESCSARTRSSAAAMQMALAANVFSSKFRKHAFDGHVSVNIFLAMPCRAGLGFRQEVPGTGTEITPGEGQEERA